MSARLSLRTRRPAADWLAADALIVAFAVLVTLLLDVVPGWSTPLRAWLVLSTWLFTTLSLHAFAQAVRAARRRGWRRTALAMAVGAGLALAAVTTATLERRLPAGETRDFDDIPPRATGASR